MHSLYEMLVLSSQSAVLYLAYLILTLLHVVHSSGVDGKNIPGWYSTIQFCFSVIASDQIDSNGFR